MIVDGNGVTAASKVGAGHYTVTFNQSIFNCWWSAMVASQDAANPVAGQIQLGSGNGLPNNKIDVFTRDSTGTLADLGSTGGTYGFFITVFC